MQRFFRVVQKRHPDLAAHLVDFDPARHGPSELVEGLDKRTEDDRRHIEKSEKIMRRDPEQAFLQEAMIGQFNREIQEREKLKSLLCKWLEENGQ